MCCIRGHGNEGLSHLSNRALSLGAGTVGPIGEESKVCFAAAPIKLHVVIFVLQLLFSFWFRSSSCRWLFRRFSGYS